MDDGIHTVVLTDLTQGISFDYVTITLGLDTPVRGKTLIADNKDSTIRFSGVWKESSQFYDGFAGRPIAAHGNTTHITHNIGDIVQFPFTGKCYFFGTVSYVISSDQSRILCGRLWFLPMGLIRKYKAGYIH